MRGFRFTCWYIYKSEEGYLAVELMVSDGKYPTKKDIVDLAKATFIRERVKKYGNFGKDSFEEDYFSVCITNIQEYTPEDYFNWIGYKSKEE
jgi:hypothetical protein